jgi:hypothetical protein
MAGLVPAISIEKTLRIRNRDARAKPAHDATLDCFVALRAPRNDKVAAPLRHYFDARGNARDLHKPPPSHSTPPPISASDKLHRLAETGGNVMRRANFLLWRVLSVAAFLIFLVHLAGSAQAQEQVSEETRRACEPEAIRLCRDVIPDVPKITACMEANYAQINQECRAAIVREGNARRAPARAERVNASSGNRDW